MRDGRDTAGGKNMADGRDTADRKSMRDGKDAQDLQKKMIEAIMHTDNSTVSETAGLDIKI